MAAMAAAAEAEVESDAKVAAMGGSAGCSGASVVTGGPGCGMRVKVKCSAHLPILFLQGGGNSCTFLAGTFLPVVQGHVICKKWHICRMFWGNCKHKTSMYPPPQTWPPH